MFNFSKKSTDILFTVDKKLQLLANETLKISPYDFAIISGLRTLNEQKILFDKGLSKCDGIKIKSKHQSGKAIDIMCYNEINIGTWDERYYIEVGKAFKQKAKELNIKIKCGGDWKNFKDYAHFELV